MRIIIPLAIFVLLPTVFVRAENDNPFAPPGSADEYHKLAVESLIAGKQKEAERLLEEGLGQYYNDQRLMFLQAACLRSRVKKREVLISFFAAQIIDPDSAYGQAASHILALDCDKDVELDVHFAALGKLADENHGDMVFRWMLAIQCAWHKRTQEGISHFEKILSECKPGPVLVHLTYAILLDRAERREDALAERRKAVELQRASWSLQALANSLSNFGRYEEAYEAFTESVDRNPTRSETWRHWAISLKNQRRYAEAAEKCFVCLKLDRSDWEAWRLFGSIHHRMNEYDKAIADFNMALSLKPSDAGSYFAMGWVYSDIKQYDKAIACYDKALKYDPTHVNAINSRGVAYRMKFQFRRAIVDYSKAISLDPDHVFALANRGFVYLHIGEIDKAIADTSRVIGLDRNYLDAYQTRATAYRKKGDLDSEIADLNEIIRLSPDNETAYRMRAAAHKRKGNDSAAESDLDKARVLKYRFP